MPPDAPLSLSGVLNAGADGSRMLVGPRVSIPLVSGHGDFSTLRGRNILLDVGEQFDAARAMIGLDGVAARMVVCPPGLPADHREAIAAKARIDVVVDDAWLAGVPEAKASASGAPHIETEWLLLTSGTTGVPKLVSHTLRGLTGAIAGTVPASAPVWATFYDIRRYGGLQIFLRAVFGTGSMVLPGLDEPLAALLPRYGARGVTHISGTPSHWRRVLMNPAASAFSPLYVRLSGEIADQAVLDALQRQYPHAKVGHAYASTEAGVGFEVNDGKEGFPASYVDGGLAGVAMKVVDDTLRIRSTRTASGYVGEALTLRDADGFVDTGDIVMRRGDRYFFAGRRGGIINIGGQKVHPEEIEAVINRHRAVRMSLVKSRKNPIMGAVVAAEVVLDDAAGDNGDAIRREIEASCRDALASWKVPATIRFVPSLAVTAAGKLTRSNA